MKKRILSAFIATLMATSLMSVTAFADVYVNGNNKEHGSYTHGSDANYVSANASGDNLTVEGDVNGEECFDSVSASDGAEITVNGTVTCDKADDCSQSAVCASSGASVKTGNVVAGNGDVAIYAEGEGTRISTKNVVKTGDVSYAIFVENAEVTVDGSINETGNGYAIFAKKSAEVKVGGDVKADGNGNAIYAEGDAIVIVEGEAAGTIEASDTDTTGTGASVYLGALEGTIENGSSGRVFYLVGLDNSSAGWNDLIVEGTEGEKTGVHKTYKTTKSDYEVAGTEITIRPSSGDKELKFDMSNLPTGVSANIVDGVLKLTLGAGFKGGLQNLSIILNSILKPQDPDGPTPAVVEVTEITEKSNTPTVTEVERPINLVQTDKTEVAGDTDTVIPSDTFNLSSFTTPQGIEYAINTVIERTNAQVAVAALLNEEAPKQVNIYTGKPVTINRAIAAAICESEVDFVYYFVYDGYLMSVTVPHGTNPELILEENGSAGPLWIGKVLGTTKIIKKIQPAME